jgi:hypothetical protein
LEKNINAYIYVAPEDKITHLKWKQGRPTLWSTAFRFGTLWNGNFVFWLCVNTLPLEIGLPA